MKNYTFFTLLLLALSCRSQTDVFHQEWIGHITLFGQRQYAQITSKKDTITLRLPDEGPTARYRISGIEKEGNEIKFNTIHGKDEWHFSGHEVNGDLLKGTFQARDLVGKFLFYKRIQIEKDAWQPCLGNYQLPSGDFLRVWQRGENLRLHSGISQLYKGLKKIGNNRFLSSSGEILQFEGLQNGQFQTVEWQSFDGQKIMAKRVAPIRVEEHLIVTSTDTIGASLYLPNTKGKHPACVIPIGAARYDRSASDMEAELFATYGIATLIYDNHGYGKSSGNLLEKSFVDKQKVAIELFRWLQNHPEIDRAKVGFRGASQGGRIAVMSASELPETAFLLLVAAPMETRMDQQLYALSVLHRQRNFSEEAVARSTEVWRNFFVHAVDGKIDTAFVREAQAVRAMYPSMELPNPSLGSPPYYPWQDDILNSTGSYLSTVQCPVLCQFGALDDRVPAQKSIHQLRSGLENAGQGPPEVIVYDGVSHSFMLPGYRIVKGYFMDQIRFMRKVVELD